MKAYKIFKASTKVARLEKTLNKLDEKGYVYVDILSGKGIFMRCFYIIAREKE